jgi:hypothetical protein
MIHVGRKLLGWGACNVRGPFYLTRVQAWSNPEVISVVVLQAVAACMGLISSIYEVSASAKFWSGVIVVQRLLLHD